MLPRPPDGEGSCCCCCRMPEMLAPLDYASPEIMGMEEEVVICAALDSGAVEHVASPDDIPAGVMVEQPDDLRDFVGAGGHNIKHYGKAKIMMEQEDGKELIGTVQVADVVRPLHSVSRIADTKKEILFTADEAVVVPAGTLSKLLKELDVVARYPRKGGLYVSRMKVRNPDAAAKKTGFGRQGEGR